MAENEIKKSFFDRWVEYIEKAGSRSHKYIRKIPNSKGGWYYIYPADFKKPIKALLSFFGMKEEKIDNAYEKNDINKLYGVTKESFAAHILEYLTNRAKWNNFFSDKKTREVYKNPGKTAGGNKTSNTNTEKKTENEKKEPKQTWNKSLMRKIYSMYNKVPEDKNTPVDNSLISTGDKVTLNGRTGVVQNIQDNGMGFVKFDDGGMGRFKLNDMQKINTESTENVVVSDAKPLESHSRDEIISICDKKIAAYRKIGDYNGAKGWEVTKEHFQNMTETPYEAKIFGLVDSPESEAEKISNSKSKENSTREEFKQQYIREIKNDKTFYNQIKEEIRNSPIPEIGETLSAYNDSKFREFEAKGISPTGNEANGFGDALSEVIKEIRAESEAEKTQNRSEAMLGNDNAKKDEVVAEEVTKEVGKLESDKIEFKQLVDRRNELDKEIKANGGNSYRHTTQEQDEKRIAAQKALKEVEQKLEDFSVRMNVENPETYKIPSVYHDTVNEWIKRKLKGQTISWVWLDKKFGARASDMLKFGDNCSLNLSDTEDINNPIVNLYYTEPNRDYAYNIMIDVGKMNEEQYRPRYMNMDGELWSEVYKRFENFRQQINSATGNTPAEKLFNTVMGTNNAYNENSETPNLPRFRFTKDGIKDKNGTLIKVDASVRNVGEKDEYIRMYADDYGHSIPSIFYPENDSDVYTDYFEKDNCDVHPDHPYYNHLKIMALKKELFRSRATKWNTLTKEQQKAIENEIKKLEKQLVEPTEEDLKNYRERRDKQEDAKAAWKEAENRVREEKKQEQENNKIKENQEKLRNLIAKFTEAVAKEPPVDLSGLDKQGKIDALNDRIFKLGVEINNLTDSETIESKKQFRDKLQQSLEKIKNEPDVVAAPQESEAEKTENRSEAMMGNQNAKKLFFDEFESLRKPQKFNGNEIRSDDEIISYLAHSNRGTDIYNAFENEGITNIQDKREYVKKLLKEYDVQNSGFHIVKPEDIGGRIIDSKAERADIYDQAYKANIDKYKGMPKDELKKKNQELLAQFNSLPKNSEEAVRIDGERYAIMAEYNKPVEETKVTVDEAKNNLSDLESQIGQGNGFELDKKLADARNTLARAEMDEKDSNDGISTPIPTIDPKVAQRINDISMSGGGGDVYQHDVNAEMKEFRDMFNTDGMNQQQKEYFQERINAYASLVGSSYGEMANKRLSAGPSWVVAGPAKFNNKRYQQKMDAEMKAYENFREKKDKFIKNTEKRLKELKYSGGNETVEDVKKKAFEDYAHGQYGYGDKIDNTDPYAIEKISGKIKYMEDAHTVTLMYQKKCRKAGITTVDYLDRTDEDKAKRKEVMREVIKEAKENGIYDESIKQGLNHPFSQNQTADIRRNKERLEELQKRQAVIDAQKAAETNTSGGNSVNTGRVDFDGGYIYENPEMDRIQIIYDGKPDRETIDKLKHHGFRWSPSQGAWQRQLNRNGRMAVNTVMAETGIDTKIDIDGAGEVKKSLPTIFIKNNRFLIRK